jgi:hypothetical protein
LTNASRIPREETTNLTSKSKQSEDQEPEIDYEDMLLKRFKITESVIEEARKFNSDHGIDEATSKMYVDFTIHPLQKKYQRWLRQCINPSTKRFYNMEYLKAKQLVSAIDNQYDGRKYPRIELNNLVRIKAQQGEFLVRSIMLYGMDITGNELSLFVDTADDHRELKIEYVREVNSDQTRYMGQEDENPGWGRTVAKVRNTNVIWSGQEEGTLVYDTPFSEQTVQEFTKYAKPPFSSHNGTGLSFKNEVSGATHSLSIKSLEQFCEPDFDSLWEELSRIPKDKVDIKDLVKQLQEEKLLSRSKEANEVGNPYK